MAVKRTSSGFRDLGTNPKPTTHLCDPQQVTSLASASSCIKWSPCRVTVSARRSNSKCIKYLAHSGLAISGSLVIETNTKSMVHGDTDPFTIMD